MTPSFIIMISIAAETSFASVMPEGTSAPLELLSGNVSDTFEHHVSFQQYCSFVLGDRGGNAPYGLDGDDSR